MVPLPEGHFERVHWLCVVSARCWLIFLEVLHIILISGVKVLVTVYVITSLGSLVPAVSSAVAALKATTFPPDSHVGFGL